MKKETAEKISALMLEFSARLNESIELVASDCASEDAACYKKTVAKIMGEMLIEILNPLYQEYPDLKPVELE